MSSFQCGSYWWTELTFVPSPPHGPRYTSSTTSRPSISPLGSRSSLAPGTHPLRPSAPGCPSAPGVDSDGRFLMIVKPTEHTTLYRSRGRAEILDAEPSSKKANVRNRQHFCNKGYMRATLKKIGNPNNFLFEMNRIKREKDSIVEIRA